MTARPRNRIAFVIEPNEGLQEPYCFLPEKYFIIRIPTLKLAFWELGGTRPDLVFLSVSFKLVEQVRFLESLKNLARPNFVPLILVIDWSHRLNYLPGLSWGGRIAAVDCHASGKELLALLQRVEKAG